MSETHGGAAWWSFAKGIEAMNNDEPILAELRKISAWAERQRKMTKWSLISEENEKLVTAMEKRRQADNPQSDGASN